MLLDSLLYFYVCDLFVCVGLLCGLRLWLYAYFILIKFMFLYLTIFLYCLLLCASLVLWSLVCYVGCYSCWYWLLDFDVGSCG